MLQPVALAAAHMECNSLSDTLPVLTELLAFECVSKETNVATLKHPNTPWLLVVHEAGPDAPPKQMHNHFGVRVTTGAEVDAAFAYLSAHQQEYGVSDLRPPEFSHGSFSVYFTEPGSNGMEIECYEAVLRKESGGTRLGGVRSPHWDAPLPVDRFPGRGYVPQAFTHGTLACDDMARSARFYQDVLGLEAQRAYPRVTYVKHPSTKHYVVCAERPQHNRYSSNFRFTLNLASPEAVEVGHRSLQSEGGAAGVTDLGGMETEGERAFFLLRDPDGNCWEITS